jgi:ribonuclease T2
VTAPRRIAALLAALALAGCDEDPSFDHLVLALSWDPTFCQFNADKPECRTLGAGDFAATHLVIHGLWPDTAESERLRYCGVDEKIRTLDQSNRWCELPEPRLSAGTRAALDAAMPGARSCLDRHEWTEHGSCSGVDAERYFATTLRLAAAVQASAFGDLLAASVGRAVPRRKLIEAFETSFGRGAAGALTLLCTHSGADSLLIEVRITLEPSAIRGALGSADLRRRTSGTAGSCPASIRIDAIGP